MDYELGKELKRVIGNISKKMEELKQLVQEDFNRGVQLIFETYPEVEEINWRQYTDYYNDGDTSEFSIKSVYVNGFDDYGDMDWDREDDEKECTLSKDLIKQIIDFVYGIPSDLMKDIFGDHTSISITREGITVEDYSNHD
ncbi:MAG: hypothetical protein AABY07_00395 [Nanoarchaeota archaeon]